MKSLSPAQTFLKKIGISTILLTFVMAGFPLTSFAAGPTVDIKANGSDGPITLNSGDTYTYTWTSANVTSCQLTSPANSGIPLSGTSATIGAGNPFYPAIGGSVTLTVTCTDGVTTATDSVTINLSNTPPPPPPPATTTPSVDIKANGSDGPITINSGDTYVYTWTSANASSCQITSPVNSGVPLSGTSAAIGAGNPFYPTTSSPTTITITCTDGVNTATDAVTINLAGSIIPPPPPPATTTPAVTLVANPTSVAPNATSTLTWTSTNTISCSAPWTSATSTAGSQIVTVATTTTYSIACTDGTQTANAQATVTVVPPAPPGGGSCPVPAITSTLAVTTTVNQPFTYTITSAATTSPAFNVASSTLPVGLSYSTSTATISGTPTVEGVYTITLTSTDICGTDTQNLVLTVGPVAPNNNGGGGGGGGGGIINGIGGHRQDVPVGSTGGSCLYLHDYMRIDFQNDPEQVTMLQIFLKDMEHYDYVTVNGVFDQATFNAVEAFQQQYASDILTPWGITAPTGYVYILTLKKINEIYCQTVYPLNTAQQNEISAYRALLQSLQNQGITPLIPGTTVGTSTQTVTIPIVGEVSPPKGQNFSNVAAAIFAGPPNLLAALQCFYQWLLILVIIYILGDIMKDVLYSDTVENVLKRFMSKWITISTALFIAIVIAWILKDWCLILPLAIALIFSLVWMSLYPKQSSLRATVKSWYIVVSARTKSVWTKVTKRNSTVVPPPVSPKDSDKDQKPRP